MPRFLSINAWALKSWNVSFGFKLNAFLYPCNVSCYFLDPQFICWNLKSSLSVVSRIRQKRQSSILAWQQSSILAWRLVTSNVDPMDTLLKWDTCWRKWMIDFEGSKYLKRELHKVSRCPKWREVHPIDVSLRKLSWPRGSKYRLEHPESKLGPQSNESLGIF